MPQIEIPFTTLFEQRENGQLLARPLLLDDVSCLGDSADKLMSKVAARVREVLENTPNVAVHRHLFAGELGQEVVAVEIEPTKRTTAWRRKLEIPLHVVHWRHGREAHVALVPALGIEVIAEDEKQLADRVLRHIHFTLMRTGRTQSLAQLIQLDRTVSLEIRAQTQTIKLRTPKQHNEARRHREDEEKSTLSDVADEWRAKDFTPAYQRDDLVMQLQEYLATPHRESVLLVGPSGVGKTTLLTEIVRRKSLRGVRVYGTAGSRIVAGMSGFGMWQDRCRKLIADIRRRDGILHVGSLVELIEVGKYAGNEEGIAGFLRPYIARGDITVVAECTPEQLAVIERRDSTVLDAFRQLTVVPPTREQGQSILLSCALETTGGKPRKESPIDAEALETLDRLHRRFATYSAFPGRPLRFLRDLLAAHHEQGTIDASRVTGAFADETGLPRFLLDDAHPLDLAATLAWFRERIIAQEEPVRLIVDLLATLKAELSRRGRPIASMLFIGPTGVGKTETAKALAEFLYRDPKRMIRIDMSEYADPLSVERLTGGSCAAEGLLTGKIRQQPFSVVLLDEFEKAHPLFFDLLLQVLGEGRLTDSVGRVADFANAVVIMTSNLGARSFQNASLGFADTRHTAGGAREHFEREVRQTVRPELFNRIDRIVPFLPLDREAAAGIARRTIELLRQRDGLRFRDVAFACDDEAAAHLAEEGYSVVYGARPLQRAVERAVVAPLAHRLNTYDGDLPLAATISFDHKTPDARLVVDLAPAIDTQVRRRRRDDERTNLLRCVEHGLLTRRRSQAISGGAQALSLRNELYQLEQLERRLDKKKAAGRRRPYDHLGRLSHLKRVVLEIDRLTADAAALEDEILTAFHSQSQHAAESTPAWESSLEAIDARMLASARSMLRMRYDKPNRAALLIFGQTTANVVQLARVYLEVIGRRQGGVNLWEIVQEPAARKKPLSAIQIPVSDLPEGSQRRPFVDLLPIANRDAWLEQPRDDAFGAVLAIECEDAVPLLEDETGLHVFQRQGKHAACLVQVSDRPVKQLEAPAAALRRGGVGVKPARRTYDLQRRTIDEPQLSSPILFRRLEETLADRLEEQFDEKVWRDVEQWK
ncbi:MAG: AAA family ATPase [Pirellulaceae bacterium]